MDLLFVYGTLRRGSRNKFARLLQSQAEFAGNARIPGRLLDLGRFPGAIATDQTGETVFGEIYRLEDPEKLLATLDEYEGPEFERVMVKAQLNSGRKRKAWVYLYRGKRTGPLIASGDWLRR
jgi:gamma-glutamylcyclotransferase (GGCT)/AIG2-like uncharacterized protein YtfP